ncbi:factor of DNA methylation 1-like [Panicum miliaceum]|uniref:Factor of DNA methylation 1-like n=1 Tax=Panicum miliaceum TaxID=4540 RepID=A0A3L6SSC5_PANMI|nr:factor of DNA methylation 1-like [Panicum miliaceum]
MPPSGGDDRAGEGSERFMRRGVGRSTAAVAAAGQDLGAEPGNRKRKVSVMSRDTGSLVGSGEHLKVACDDSQRILNEIEDLRAQLDEDVKNLGYCEANQKLRVELALKAKEVLEVKLNGRTAIGIKRMGELYEKPFQNACKRKYGSDDYLAKAAELASNWQEELKKPSWHPFKVVQDNGEYKEFLDDDDAKLKYLRTEYGDNVCNAVKTALMEINEYNPSGGYVVPEFWNFNEGRKATMKEVLNYLFRKMETTTKRSAGGAE